METDSQGCDTKAGFGTGFIFLEIHVSRPTLYLMTQ